MRNQYRFFIFLVAALISAILVMNKLNNVIFQPPIKNDADNHFKPLDNLNSSTNQRNDTEVSFNNGLHQLTQRSQIKVKFDVAAHVFQYPVPSMTNCFEPIWYLTLR